ncbi:MAG: ATP-dependent DNA helicase, partial [Chitinophagia bacterium]|nr:ATP-dependent DNA helicase [Chitinophagia bacterium]
ELLIKHGIDPFNILALTFTNKAAAEMKHRIESILGTSEARNLFIGTFHSVFARLLRVDAVKLGYPANFTIYDGEDSKSVIKDLLKARNLDDKVYKPAQVSGRISGAKNNLISPEEYNNDYAIMQEDAKSNRPRMGELYLAYANQCYKNGAMDFDDLLYNMYVVLIKFPEVLAKYQHKFQYILIDEYQDTNIAQYQVIKKMAAVNENICVVGDDAQSIYSFRGATIQNILQFNKDYEDAKVIKLEQNYRSTQTILLAANRVIASNKKQIPKKLWTSNGVGEKIKFVQTATENEEGKYVADAIKEQQMRHHYPNDDFAILYRTNAQSRSFEESLRRLNIRYKIYGGLSFYQRKEVKDMLAYLRVVVNTRDEENLKRIINYPARGIGKATIDKIVVIAAEEGRTFWNVIERGSGSAKIDNFVMMIKAFQAMLTTKNAYEVATELAKHCGLNAELYNDKTAEGLARYENLQELLNSIKEFTVTPDEDGDLTDKSLGRYLQEISLQTDVAEQETDKDTVKLMTIHAAKGLEFPCVFVAGLEEQLFPSSQSLYDREGLEEERRLFYVAITRAKQKLWLTYANSRYRFGSLIQNEPSRFLLEIPEEQVDSTFIGARYNLDNDFSSRVKNKSPNYNDHTAKGKQPTYTNPIEAKKASQPTPPAHTPNANFTPSPASAIEVGMKIEHLKFGYGIVQTIEGGNNNPIANIDFGSGHGIKKIMLNYAKIAIVKD